MPVDYDKLAKQHGGSEVAPDYDAIASEVSASGTLNRTTGISETPWFDRPIGNKAGFVPGGVLVRNVTPREALEALPALGGALGGLVGGGIGSIGTAMIGGAGGEAARQLIRRKLGVKSPATSEEAALDIGKQAAIQGGAQAVGVGAQAALERMAPRLMQSALKPNPSLLKEYKTTAPKIVKTLLDEGVNVTPGGIEKLQNLLNMTNQEISDLVKASAATIDKKAVAARVADTALKTARQVNPTKDLQAVGDVVDEFLQHPIYPGQTLTAPEAQALKQGTYQQIGKKYGEMSSASVEAQKALARGLKEEVADAVPEIAQLNQRDARLMAALDATGRRVAVAANRDPVGFAWVTQNPKTFLAALMDRSPVIKSMLARGMYQSAAKVGKVSPELIRAAVVAVAIEHDAEPPPE